MRKVTKLMFTLSDLYASILLIVALSGAISFPFLGRVAAQMANKQASLLVIVTTSTVWLLTAIGAYAVTRHRVAGLALMVLPSGLSLANGSLSSAAAFISVSLAVCGTPFLLAALEASKAFPDHTDADSPRNRQQLADQLRNLAETPLDDASALDSVQSRSIALSSHLQSEALADFVVPELVWHFLADADIRFKDAEYAAMQCDAIFALTDHWRQDVDLDRYQQPDSLERGNSPWIR